MITYSTVIYNFANGYRKLLINRLKSYLYAVFCFHILPTADFLFFNGKFEILWVYLIGFTIGLALGMLFTGRKYLDSCSFDGNRLNLILTNYLGKRRKITLDISDIRRVKFRSRFQNVLWIHTDNEVYHIVGVGKELEKGLIPRLDVKFI